MYRLLQAAQLITEAEAHLRAAQQALADQQKARAAAALAVAEENASTALALCCEHKLFPELTAMGLLAAVYMLQAKYPQARALLQERLVLAEQRHDSRTQQASIEGLGKVSLQMEEWEDAKTRYQQALALFEARRRALSAEAIQTTFGEEGVNLYERLIQIAVQRGERAEAWERAEQAKSRALLNLLGTIPLPCPSTVPALVLQEKALLAEVRDVAATWQNPDGQAVAVQNKLWPRWIQLDRDLEHVWQAMNLEETCAEYIALRRGTSPDLTTVQKALTDSRDNAATKVALLTYFVGKDTVWLCIVRPDKPEPLVCDLQVEPGHLQRCAQRLHIDFNLLRHDWKETEAFFQLTPRVLSELRAAAVPPHLVDKLASVKKIYRGQNRFLEILRAKLGDEPITRYKSMILKSVRTDIEEALVLPPEISPLRRKQDPEGAGPDPLLLRQPYRYQMMYLDQLSAALLPQTTHAWLADRDLLCISAHGPLHRLPFHAMRWHNGSYLIEHFGVCYVPSAGVLRHCQRRNRIRQGRAPRTCLFAGVDMYQGQATDFEKDDHFLASLFTDRGERGRYLALKGATGTESATKHRIAREIGQFDVIHLACHGLFAADRGWDNPLKSGLLLADGNHHRLHQNDPIPNDCLLTAHEVFGQNLDADLVTLRACSSGRVHVEAGDELLGLSRAFLYAGTPSLLVSLWNVNTKTSYRLLETFYQKWLLGEAGTPKWKALQQAQQDLLCDDDERYHHPYHWAPFVLMGDWV